MEKIIYHIVLLSTVGFSLTSNTCKTVLEYSHKIDSLQTISRVLTSGRTKTSDPFIDTTIVKLEYVTQLLTYLENQRDLIEDYSANIEANDQSHDGNAFSARFPTAEVGGTISFVHTADKHYSNNIFNFEPYLSVYRSSLFMGPLVAIVVTNGQLYDDEYMFLFGVHGGYVFSKKLKLVNPYADMGAAATINTMPQQKGLGIYLPIELGLKICAGKSTFINFGIDYSIHTNSSNAIHSFGTIIGLSCYK